MFRCHAFLRKFPLDFGQGGVSRRGNSKVGVFCRMPRCTFWGSECKLVITLASASPHIKPHSSQARKSGEHFATQPCEIIRSFCKQAVQKSLVFASFFGHNLWYQPCPVLSISMGWESLGSYCCSWNLFWYLILPCPLEISKSLQKLKSCSDRLAKSK